MKIKPIALEEIIEKEVKDLQTWTESKFAIDVQNGYEVHVVVTRESDDFMGMVDKKYAEAKE